MQRIFYLILSIFILSACSTTPGPNLASKASLIHKDVSTKTEVLAYLGPPVQAFIRPDKREEWYYYYRVKNFWENFPIVKGFKGEDYTEILKIVFEGEKVVEVTYYTLVNPEKQKR